MTGKERILLAFQHKEGDRIPIYEQAISSDVASEVMGREVFAQGTSLHYEDAKAWINGKVKERIWTSDLLGKCELRYFMQRHKSRCHK